MVSSPSRTSKKATKFPPIQQTLFKSSSLKAASLLKRKETLFKKGFELKTLCDVEVCVICYEPDGVLTTWPEDRDKVKEIARRYIELSEPKRRRGQLDLREFLDKYKKEDSSSFSSTNNVKLGSNLKFPDWDPRFDDFNLEQCMGLFQSLELNQTRIQERRRVCVEDQNQKKMKNPNMSDQTQNHLQQHSNLVSIVYNNTLSQIHNQEQVLAPLPASLQIHPNFNIEDYSDLLLEQGAGINEFQNSNMYLNSSNNLNNFNNFNNMGMDSYLGLLGVQGTEFIGMQGTGFIGKQETELIGRQGTGLIGTQGTEFIGKQETGFIGLQNPNMFKYNNNSNVNGVSHQLVKFPTKRPAPGTLWINQQLL